ncbi:MAG: transglutaminase family protein [Bacteroidetes bacterium]|jgi:transglutaminase-like putative cysteine protease|nr:MAG: transglutaminase family protein [Bacteroidota bacterium]
MPVFNIHHVTKYEYDRPVKESVNEIRIYPFSGPGQEALFHELNVTSQPDILLINDYWGNRAGMFNLMAAHKSMIVESKLIVRTLGKEGIPASQAGFDELRKEVANNLLLLELSFLHETELREKIGMLSNEIATPGSSVMQTVELCSHYIYDNFQYIKGITTIETTVTEILDHRSGVCQDFAHVMLEILRNLQIPSRYVSGYICPNKNGMRGEGATHAWVEAWIPGIGWTGIDPTNNVWVTNHHVKLAVGRHFNDCSPIKGTFKGPARQSLSVFVSVGYEDGNTFEDVTSVKMQTQEGVSDLPDILESFAGQQQQ